MSILVIEHIRTYVYRKRRLLDIANKLKSWSRGYKTFFMLSSAEHEIFSANKYENAKNSWHFHIYLQRKFHVQLCSA